jgi:dTDP-4-amino-4,6-dideoxygalactose transaminase
MTPAYHADPVSRQVAMSSAGSQSSSRDNELPTSAASRHPDAMAIPHRLVSDRESLVQATDEITTNPQTATMKRTDTQDRPLPRTPILDWSSFSRREPAARVHSIDDIGHIAVTTSGRAAIYQALLQLRLAPGSVVLVPTYHCPTMVAPVILANLEVAYFGIRADGLPDLESIEAATADRAKAIIVSHYFGLAQSLAEVRQWCDERRIALIEDCAHCYFGDAGERPVGTWGDFSTASLSKFFPVPEGGVLASAMTPIPALHLSAQGFKAELKAWADVIESAIKYGRFSGINWALKGVFRVKNAIGHAKAKTIGTEEPSATSMMLACDMDRISQAPLAAASTLKAILPRGQIVASRRRNFAIYARHFEHARGAHALFPSSSVEAVPYVFPLWVEDPHRIFHALREQELPVFRWDRIWPGTPHHPHDVGPLWSHHVLQLLCHQNLSAADVTRTALATLSLLSDGETSAIAPAQ